ncbi:hypothetical protein [Salipiger mangrovisoli]|uniref:Uncharacterized protein n=1 Tax=Salipiger mangrovisoli TaxID=2865933 RepID=A0ABR9WY48_9RHOB|nr:hypothetical protein [Salipiger mangrovisoli]MBE9636224.1 hypothetical protein [Salipiger mangrovisoli]
MKLVKLLALLCGLAPFPAQAKEIRLLLFDAKTHENFAGCLNCDKSDPEAVCNDYGAYGSRLMTNSIWNLHGTFGSKFSDDSPWSAGGEGLVVIDDSGKFYGHFSNNLSINRNQPTLANVRYLLKLYATYDDLSIVRDLLCER